MLRRELDNQLNDLDEMTHALNAFLDNRTSTARNLQLLPTRKPLQGFELPAQADVRQIRTQVYAAHEVPWWKRKTNQVYLGGLFAFTLLAGYIYERSTITPTLPALYSEGFLPVGKPPDSKDPKDLEKGKERHQVITHMNDLFARGNDYAALIEETKKYVAPALAAKNTDFLETVLPMTFDRETRFAIINTLYEKRKNGQWEGHDPLPKPFEQWIEANFSHELHTNEKGDDTADIQNFAPYEAMAQSIEAIKYARAHGVFANPDSVEANPGFWTSLLSWESGSSLHFNTANPNAACPDDNCSNYLAKLPARQNEIVGINYPDTVFIGSVARAQGPAQIMPSSLYAWLDLTSERGYPLNLFDTKDAVILAMMHLQEGMPDAVHDNPHRKLYVDFRQPVDARESFRLLWNSQHPTEPYSIFDLGKNFVDTFPNWRQMIGIGPPEAASHEIPNLYTVGISDHQPMLQPLSERLTAQEITKNTLLPSYYAAPPWGKLEEKFSLDKIRASIDIHDPQQVHAALKQRREAIDKWLRAFHAPLSELPSTQIRAHIDLDYAFTKADSIRDEFGLDYDPLIDDIQIQNARLLLEMGYDVKTLDLGNLRGAVTKQDVLDDLDPKFAGLSVYFPLDGDRGRQQMIEAYTRLYSALTQDISLRPGQCTIVKDNEMDIINHLFTKDTGKTTQLVTPRQWWDDYYALAPALAHAGITLEPSSMALVADGQPISDDQSFDPWLAEQAATKARLGTLPDTLDDAVRITGYFKDAQDAHSRLDWLTDQITRLNARYSQNLHVAGIQEVGIAPFPGQDAPQTVYDIRTSQLVPVLDTVSSYKSPVVDFDEISVFSMPYPPDGYPTDNTDIGIDGQPYMLRNEPGQWPLFKDWLNRHKN